ncbi:type VI secretion protein [Citrobacter sedlakii]|nr:type VI secretion protein [Citrobacter sedlakii]
MSTGLRFTLEVDGLPADALVVESFHLEQSLSSLFTLDISLVSQQLLSIDFSQVLEKTAHLKIWQGDEIQRRVNGIMTWFEQGENDGRQMLYSMKVRPPLWRASLRQNPDCIITGTGTTIRGREGISRRIRLDYVAGGTYTYIR